MCAVDVASFEAFVLDAEMLEMWGSPTVLSAVADYVKKTLGK